MEPTSFDELMGRAFDGAARADEWEALEGAVRCEPLLAAALVRGLRVERGLEAALGRATAVAERVELPHARASATRRFAAGRLAGWIAAAGIALAWTFSAGAGGTTAVPAAAPDPAALVAGVVEGAERPVDAAPSRVDPALEPLGELPLRLVSSRPLASGRYEVLYVRPVLERTVVDGALGLAPDESGQPHVVPASFETPAHARSF